MFTTPPDPSVETALAHWIPLAGNVLRTVPFALVRQGPVTIPVRAFQGTVLPALDQFLFLFSEVCFSTGYS